MTWSTEYGGQGRARDAFLDALDGGDTAHAIQVAGTLTSCTNPLPSITCIELRLPIGSTYGEAARSLLAQKEASKCL